MSHPGLTATSEVEDDPTIDEAPSLGEPRSALAERAVHAAAQSVARGRRIEMQGLADELGISRVTLFRNVGTRDELLSGALWHLTDQVLHLAARRWEAERPDGALYSIGTGEHLNVLVSRSGPLHQLLRAEPALTIRLLTDPCGRVQSGVVDFVEDLLRRDMRDHGLVPIAEPRDLAFALVRLGESFLYSDVLASRPPDVDAANRVQRALVEGSGQHERSEPSSSRNRKRR